MSFSLTILLLSESAIRESFVLMDSTYVMSASECLEVNTKGYNGSFYFGKQVRLRRPASRRGCRQSQGLLVKAGIGYLN
ncbi:MAG: hypothetical protein LBD47_10140 [Treponema sp.]|jgi:hypothetical protein|nr:hypothetical protein [Treponema sp.]